MSQSLLDYAYYWFYRFIDLFQPQTQYCILGYTQSSSYTPAIFTEITDLLQRSFANNDTRSSPIETQYSYSVEYKNFYMTVFKLNYYSTYYTEENIYNYYIKGKAGLLLTIEVTNHTWESDDLPNRIQFVLKKIGKNVPVLFIIHGLQEPMGKHANSIAEMVQQMVRKHDHEEYSCIVTKENGKDGALYEGLEWLFIMSAK
ncbi:hypothetical protein C9374_009312 [Naegleria lovaniensis]|uniref:Uncharacterized protein n=1 Tax=Naegleria lovaniensis TaxID=51637 RepID=A0AA88GHR6_NAELO|nr:uncharacterized protein C9374_009312 [Naegleria lovaniensis]KAG2377401.1 hypothetical protein C9374_009312 [Naegleria lovaniensis]